MKHKKILNAVDTFNDALMKAGSPERVSLQLDVNTGEVQGINVYPTRSAAKAAYSQNIQGVRITQAFMDETKDWTLRDYPAEERAAKKCGAPAGAGACILPHAHNMGSVDIPENHKAEEPLTAIPSGADIVKAYTRYLSGEVERLRVKVDELVQNEKSAKYPPTRAENSPEEFSEAMQQAAKLTAQAPDVDSGSDWDRPTPPGQQ